MSGYNWDDDEDRNDTKVFDDREFNRGENHNYVTSCPLPLSDIEEYCDRVNAGEGNPIEGGVIFVGSTPANENVIITTGEDGSPTGGWVESPLLQKLIDDNA